MKYQLCIRMRRKIIDDIGCNIWMISLKLNYFFLWSESNIETFWICMDATFFGMQSPS